MIAQLMRNANKLEDDKKEIGIKLRNPSTTQETMDSQDLKTEIRSIHVI